jgi:hypothetical protein
VIRRRLPFAFACAISACSGACSGLKASPDAPDATPDGAVVGDASGGSRGDGAADGGPIVRDGAPDPGACKTIPLECLDPSPANVIEVPTEATIADALASAKPGDTVQVRSQTLGAGWRVPAHVTLRGCSGATLDSTISFVGTVGAVEGFTVKGSIVANQTGIYAVRANRFVGGGAPNEAGVSARAIDGLVGASVTIVVEANSFASRPLGIAALTTYDTQTRVVDLTVRNNVFSRVSSPITVSEDGVVGVIHAKIEHNTFFDFQTAIALRSIDRNSTTSGNLFVFGTTAVGGGSTYDVAHSLVWQVTTPGGTPPLSGTFPTGDPLFVDSAGGDFRLGPGSAALDRVPDGTTAPPDDYRGCPRPAGSPPKADIGAIEMQ